MLVSIDYTDTFILSADKRKVLTSDGKYEENVPPLYAQKSITQNNLEIGIFNSQDTHL